MYRLDAIIPQVAETVQQMVIVPRNKRSRSAGSGWAIETQWGVVTVDWSLSITDMHIKFESLFPHLSHESIEIKLRLSSLRVLFVCFCAGSVADLIGKQVHEIYYSRVKVYKLINIYISVFAMRYHIPSFKKGFVNKPGFGLILTIINTKDMGYLPQCFRI